MDGIGVSVDEPQGSVAASTIIDINEMDIEGEDDIGEDEDGTDFVFDLDALKETHTNVPPTLTTQPKQGASTAPHGPLEPEPALNNNDNHQDTSPAPLTSPPTTADIMKAQLKTSPPTAADVMNNQLEQTMEAQNQKSAEMQLGEETMDLDLPDGPPSLAVVLEETTGNNNPTMLQLLELLQAEVSGTDTLAPSATPMNTMHPLLTTALRETVLSDVSPNELVAGTTLKTCTWLW